MTEWTPICRYDRLQPERGVAALVGPAQVAVFRTHDGSVHAIDNFDPYARAHVLSRGIVGSRGDVPTVASPMHKQVDLRTGQCLTCPTWPCPHTPCGAAMESWRCDVRRRAPRL
jgi:nitrite reductase (NADH) small subunit